MNEVSELEEKYKITEEIILTLKKSLGDGITFNEIITVVDSGISDSLSPTPGIGIVKSLIGPAYNYFRKHRAKARIAYFINVKKEAQNVRNHRLLLEKAFGNSLDSDQTVNFTALSNSLERIYTFDSKTNSPRL